MALQLEFYVQVPSTLLSQDPLLSLNCVFHQVFQVERVREISRVKDEQIEVFSFKIRAGASGKGPFDKIDKSGLKCSHCQKSGHGMGECFELKAYPKSWFGTTKEGQKTSRRGNATPFMASQTEGGGHHVVMQTNLNGGTIQ